MSTILVLHFAVTWAMVGLIWLVQVVNYPLFAEVPADRFRRYEKRHVQRIGYVVGPLMVAEALTAVLLLALAPTDAMRSVALIGALLLLAIWLSTAFLQVPLHGKLEAAYDAAIHRRLVLTNWVRTWAWTARGLLLLLALLALA